MDDNAQAIGKAPWAAMTPALLAELDVGLAIKDASGDRYVHASDTLTRLLGRSASDLLAHTDADLFGKDVAAGLRATDAAALASGSSHTGEYRLLLEPDQPRRDFKVISTPVADVTGPGAAQVCHLWTDVTVMRQHEAKVAIALVQLEQQQLANEALSLEASEERLRLNAGGLYQQTQFDDQLRREVDLSTREHREFSLVSVAIDPPSEAELRLGPSARARLLGELSQLLRNNTRAMDAACRLSEERFAILLSGVGLATAHSRVETLRRQCATQIVVLDGQDFGFTISMGVASFPHTAHTQDQLLESSEMALESARRKGGNRISLASIRFEAQV
jgi:diguanylate cyclase (GGDEF)-like protein